MDLYHIPGDTGFPWRLNKFVEYQHEVPSIHYRVLGEYIKKYIPDKDDAVMMCWYMSATYNEVTCVLLQEIFQWKELTPKTVSRYCQKFWKQYKEVLDFGSSRKYAKNMDWFPMLMEEFIRLTHRHPFKWLQGVLQNDPVKSYHAVFKTLLAQSYTGRFSVELFMESILYLKDYFGIEIQEPATLDWKHCSNLTSGLLNIFYFDEEANTFDKTGELMKSEKKLVSMLKTVQAAIEEVYPEQESDINLFVGKICSFRNLFKASRYGGFHHDRELGVLRAYEKVLPEYEYLWQRVFKLRKKMFPPHLLGEVGGWDGIRKERKKLWLKGGKTGVEKDAC